MFTNTDFLEAVRDSFGAYLKVDSSRSTIKLKSLHGRIARDLQSLFGDKYKIQSQGYGDDREGSVKGRYYEKKVDIKISEQEKTVAAYAVKFIMRNYSQNSNNYFENMLGETANIRSNCIPYFQIFIVFERVPYYETGGIFKKYDIVTEHNLNKYLVLSKDNPDEFYHTPDKTLIVLLKLKEKSPGYIFRDSRDYADYYRSVLEDSDLVEYSTKITNTFGDGVILNDYSDFLRKTYLMVQKNIK